METRWKRKLRYQVILSEERDEVLHARWKVKTKRSGAFLILKTEEHYIIQFVIEGAEI